MCRVPAPLPHPCVPLPHAQLTSEGLKGLFIVSDKIADVSEVASSLDQC